MSGWLVALIVGGVAGWLASILMKRDGAMGIILTSQSACVGSIIGNALAGPLFGVEASVQSFSLPGLLIAVLGAVVLLGIVNLVQRGRVR